MKILFWLLVIAGNLGMLTWVVRKGPALAAAMRSWVDMFAYDADWPALITLGAFALVIWSIA